MRPSRGRSSRSTRSTGCSRGTRMRLVEARSVDDVEHAVTAGRIASMVGVEGGQSIGCSLGALRMLARLGATLYDAHPQRRPAVGGLRDRRASARRPHPVRRGGRARDEPARGTGRLQPRLRRRDAPGDRHQRGAGRLLPLGRPRARRRAAQRPRRRARARRSDRWRRHGDVRALVRDPGGRRHEPRVVGRDAPAPRRRIPTIPARSRATSTRGSRSSRKVR